MTLYQFRLLDEMEQVEAIWDKGIEIGKRLEDGKRFVLYQIDSFYVEVEYFTKDNLFRSITPFTSTERLKPYLDKINIKGL